MLRDPVARALSHINHVQRDLGHPLYPLAAGVSVAEYCERPVLRKTVDNFQSRYLASLDFALALSPGPAVSSGCEPYRSVSVRFENSLFSLDKETGLLEGALRALDAVEAVGICEAHRASLRVFGKALGWGVDPVEFDVNRTTDQWTLDDLSSAEIDALMRLNMIDAQVYDHARQKFLNLCGQYGIELTESERSVLTKSSAGYAVP
jgi:hypothetical protein